MEKTEQLALLRARMEEKYPGIFRLFSFEDIESVWNAGAKPAFVPFSEFAVTLAKKKIQSWGIEGTAKADAIMKMVKALERDDLITGFSGIYSRALNHDLADYYVRLHPEAKIFYVHADSNNLRGTNVILSGNVIGIDDHPTEEGKGLADLVLRMETKLFRGELEKAAKTGGATAAVKCYRVGGDEFTAMLVGDESLEVHINHALTGIDEAINGSEKVDGLCHRIGIDNIKHPKYPEERGKRGTGIACVCGEYKPADIENVEDYEAGIERFERLMDQKMEGARADQMIKKANAPTPEEDHNNARSKGMDIAFVSSKMAEVESKIYSELAALNLGKIKQRDPSFPFVSEKIVGTIPHKLYLWPTMQQVMQIRGVGQRLGMTKEERVLFEGLYQIYRTDDIVTGYRKESFGRVLQNAAHFLKEHPEHPPMTVLTFELENMSGLNKRGHGEADRHIGELMRKIDQFSSHSIIVRHKMRGGRVNVLLGAYDKNEIRRVIDNITADVYAYAEQANLTHIEHPRRPSPLTEGVRFVIGAEKLTSQSDIGQVFNSMDAQIAKNKERHICFDGAALGLKKIVAFDTTKQGLSHVKRVQRRQQLERESRDADISR